MYIPSCFFSWDNAYALDEKIPLLRSEVALSRESMRLFQVLGESKHTRVHMDAGLEQEFFLIDRKDFLARQDLMVSQGAIGVAQAHECTPASICERITSELLRLTLILSLSALFVPLLVF